MNKFALTLLAAFAVPLFAAEAKTATQVKNENKAKEYKAKKSNEKAAKAAKKHK
jgi:hypothetical protein